jgi:hypothetical protein
MKPVAVLPAMLVTEVKASLFLGHYSLWQSINLYGVFWSVQFKNRMSYSLQRLLEETPSKAYADAQATTSNLAVLWTAATRFIEDSMLKLKAVNITELGLFTFVQEKLDFGREHHKVYITPAFLISSAFTRSYNVKQLQKKPSLARMLL